MYALVKSILSRAYAYNFPLCLTPLPIPWDALSDQKPIRKINKMTHCNVCALTHTVVCLSLN